MNRTVRIILGIVVLLAVAGGSFFGGTLYGKNQAQTAFSARRARRVRWCRPERAASRPEPAGWDGPDGRPGRRALRPDQANR